MHCNERAHFHTHRLFLHCYGHNDSHSETESSVTVFYDTVLFPLHVTSQLHVLCESAYGLQQTRGCPGKPSMGDAEA